MASVCHTIQITDKDDHKDLILNSQGAPNEAKERHFSTKLNKKLRKKDFSAPLVLAPRAAARPALLLVRPWFVPLNLN